MLLKTYRFTSPATNWFTRVGRNVLEICARSLFNHFPATPELEKARVIWCEVHTAPGKHRVLIKWENGIWTTERGNCFYNCVDDALNRIRRRHCTTPNVLYVQVWYAL